MFTLELSPSCSSTCTRRYLGDFGAAGFTSVTGGGVLVSAIAASKPSASVAEIFPSASMFRMRRRSSSMVCSSSSSWVSAA